MIKELVCITCPMSCHIQVEIDERNQIKRVMGNSCPRGEKYVRKELTHPERMLTSTVRIEGGIYPMLPVMTDRTIPKDKIYDVMNEIKKIRIQAPVKYRDLIIENVCGTGANIIASRNMDKL